MERLHINEETYTGCFGSETNKEAKSQESGNFEEGGSAIQTARDGNSNLDSLIEEYGQEKVMDHVWSKKYYGHVLSLLKADYQFPDGVNISQLSDSNEDEKNLKHFIEERSRLHELIKTNNLEEIQVLVSQTKSRFYLSKENISARYYAITNKKFEIYSYLRSVGVEFLNDFEKNVLSFLDLKDRTALAEANVISFRPVSESHILYLLSKSKSPKAVDNVKSKLKGYYSELDGTPEISIILRLLQYSDFLDIVFDFDEENVEKVNPISSHNARGETMYKDGRLFIAAGPKRLERRILGTLIHEMTHMAMELLFENECNPYRSSDHENASHFKDIVRKCSEVCMSVPNGPFNTIKKIFNERLYDEKDRPNELIARVPQILVEYENGKETLVESFPDLYDFYTSIIIPKCHEFINKSQFIKPTAAIRKLNESLGEIMKLKTLHITYRTVDTNILGDFLVNENKNIFIFQTENTHLGTIKILQGIYGLNYINEYDKYLVFLSENFLSDYDNITKVFFSAPCRTLIIRFNYDSHRHKHFWDHLNDMKLKLKEFIKTKPNKKFIAVIHPNVYSDMQLRLQEVNLKKFCVHEMDACLSLDHFDEKSQSTILSKKVKFQGTEIALKRLIGADDEYLQSITEDIIENLIQEKEVNIGDKMYDQVNFKEGFTHIREEINSITFFNESWTPDDIFVIKGLSKKSDLNPYFKKFDINEKHAFFRDYIQPLPEEIQVKFDSSKINGKRLLLTNRMSDEDFNLFCQCNNDKNIYLIEAKIISNEMVLILQQFYKPNFYLKRKFKIIINSRQLENLMSKFPGENFIVSKKENFHGLKLKKEPFNVRMLNVNIKEAESDFNDQCTKEKTVHWFHAHDNNEIYWKNSSGFQIDLKTNDKFLIEEDNLIDHLSDKKIIIISDDPGMGRSTTLSKLFESHSITKTHWLFRINLKDLVENLKNTNTVNFNNLDLVELLQKIKPYLKNKLAEYLLTAALKPETTFAKRLLFAFDGFDYIQDQENREKIIMLFKYLQTIPNSKIWITTRLLYKAKLENELSTFAFRFDPLDDEKKIDFVKKYLEDHTPKLVFSQEQIRDIFQVPNSKIVTYAERFLEYIKTNFTKDLAAFIDTPLQLNLMLENSIEHFRSWAKSCIENPNFEHLGNNYIEIYEKFNDRKSEISYLISKSRSRKEMRGLKDIVHHYYSKLDEIPEISIILKVVQYSDFLDIVFDFDEECISTHETRYKEGKLCIEANPNRGEKEILGNIAYKLTQIAMEIVFHQNDCKPYRRSDGVLEEEFQRNWRKLMEIKNTAHTLFECNGNEWAPEIGSEPEIGFVTRTLIVHESGRSWLKQFSPDLFNFYTDEIIPKCREFIDTSHILKPRNAIRKLNEIFGDVTKLRFKNVPIVFRKVSAVENLLNNHDKKIFILTTGNAYMGMIKILQKTFGSNYIEEFDKYLALGFENLMSQFEEILQAFRSDASDALVVRFNRMVCTLSLKKFVNQIPEVLETKPNKNIYFIVHSNMEEELRTILSEVSYTEHETLWDICAEEKDTCSSLYYLNEESKKMILSKDVIFQGMKISLKDLIGTNPKLQKLLREDTMERLFEEKEVYIGSKTYEHFNFERACSDVDEEINMNTFINELKSSNDIFAIKGSTDLNSKEHLLNIFKEYIDKDLIDRETIASQIQLINSVNSEINNKRLLLRDPYSDIDTRKFCERNRDSKVHFIDVKRVENRPALILKQFYNPSFYLNRKFKILRINKNILEDWISRLLPLEETFLLSKEDSIDNFQLQKSNVNASDPNVIDAIFKNYVKKGMTVHWFHVQDSNNIFWVNSSGSIERLRHSIKTSELMESKQILSLIGEADIIKHFVYKKVLIIASKPGMGKSTTLTKLYDSSIIAQSHWVIRIDLEKHVKIINHIQLAGFDTDRLVKLLQKMNPYLKDRLTEDLLKSALIEEKFPKCLLLAFDGFDELKDKPDRNKIIFFLKYLINYTNSKIWVTTREEHKIELEDKLCTLALEFEPIDDDSRENYMERYLKDRLKLTLDAELTREIFSMQLKGDEKRKKIRKVSSKIRIYIEKFFEFLKHISGDKVSKYMGAPYQLNLMIDKCLNHCKTWAENNEETLDFSFLGKDITEVVEKNSSWEYNEV